MSLNTYKLILITIRLFVLDFYRVIVDEDAAQVMINYRA